VRPEQQQLPPHDVAAEEAALGAALLSARAPKRMGPEEEDWKAVAAWPQERGWRPLTGRRGRRSLWISPNPEDPAVYTRSSALRAARESEARR
jgi:hypothetical protein